MVQVHSVLEIYQGEGSNHDQVIMADYFIF